MKNIKLRRIVFLALCCDLSLIGKRLISPVANILTDFLRVPGGIGTAFSLMFLVLAAMLMPFFGCGALMGAVQSLIALSLGMMGSMGALSPIGYIVPGIVIDCTVYITKRVRMSDDITAILSNILASAAAVFAANAIIFRLKGLPLALYLSVAATGGAICGSLCGNLVKRLRPVISPESRNTENASPHNKHIPQIFVALAAAITLFLAIGRFTDTDRLYGSALMISDNESIRYIDFEEMELTEVSCSFTDGKGDENQIRAQGIPLSSIAGGEFESITVTASDGFSAVVFQNEAEKAYLIDDGSGKACLVVSGDENAKRYIKNVNKIEIR